MMGILNSAQWNVIIYIDRVLVLVVGKTKYSIMIMLYIKGS